MKNQAVLTATFKGEDSLGYSHGMKYRLLYNVQGDQVTIVRENGIGYCPYQSQLAFLRNWTDIIIHDEKPKFDPENTFSNLVELLSKDDYVKKVRTRIEEFRALANHTSDDQKFYEGIKTGLEMSVGLYAETINTKQ